MIMPWCAFSYTQGNLCYISDLSAMWSITFFFLLNFSVYVVNYIEFFTKTEFKITSFRKKNLRVVF